MKGIDWKMLEVEMITNLTRSNPVVGVASIHEIPARQLQSIRRDLRGEVSIRVSKKTLVSQAFAKCGRKNIEDLEPRMGGEVALLFTEMNPFKLFRHLEDRKVRSKAKPGHRPPEDVWVPKGETSFAPGPIVSQLQKVGIPARIERGKVVILQDTLFVKAGEQIDRARSDMLAQLGIEPMRIGLDVAAIYEDGMVFERSVLDVDPDQISEQVSMAARQALSLAFNTGYVTEATIGLLLQDAHLRARALSLSIGMPTAETIGDMLSLACQRMLSLAAALAQRDPEAVEEELRAKVAPAPGGEDVGKEETPPEEEPEAPEEEKEESVGLGALFG